MVTNLPLWRVGAQILLFLSEHELGVPGMVETLLCSRIPN